MTKLLDLYADLGGAGAVEAVRLTEFGRLDSPVGSASALAHFVETSCQAADLASS